MGARKLQLVCVLGLMLMQGVSAQQISQMAVGNYGMVHALHLNPSLPAYGAYQWQVNLAGFWANANNNYLSLRLPYSAYRIPNRIPLLYQTESGNPRFDRLWLQERLNGRTKHASVSSDVYGPSASVRVKSWTFGLFTQGSAALRVNRLPENLAHALFKELDSAQGAFSQFKTIDQGGVNTINAFSISGNSRINLGLNAAKAIQIGQGRQVLLGISVKKVWGLPGFYLQNSGMTVTTVNDDSLLFSPASMQLITYGESTGRGWGTDIGASYVFHKKDFKRNGNYAKTRTRYFCKLGLSVMDIGRIRYKDARYSTVSIDRETGVNTDRTFDETLRNNSDYLALADSFMQQFGSFRQYSADLNVGLPTRMVASADFQLKKHFFVAAVLSQSLRKKQSVHARYQSFLMLSPRFEYRYFEVSLPAMLEYDYRSLRVGASVRIGPLYIGTSSLASFLYTRGFRDADLFAGIAFGNLSEFSFRKQARARWQKRSGKQSACSVF